MLKISQRSITVLYFVLFIFILGSAEKLYSQSSASPRYGLSLEQWEQNQKSVKLKSNLNPVGGGGSNVINGGFETGDFSSWFIQDVTNPFYPLQVGTAGIQPWFDFFVSDPTEGSFALLHGWDGEVGTIQLEQDVVVPSNAISLEFDYRAAWDLQTFGGTMDRKFIVSIEPNGGGSSLQTDTLLTGVAGTINNDTGNLHGSIDVSTFANSTIRINFKWTVPENFAGPGFFQLDNVFIKYTGPQIIVADFVAFGKQEVGTSSFPRTVTISSVGTSNCTVSGISDPGSPFTLSNLPTLPVVIPPGGSETFEVTFSAANAGVFNSTINVSSDDAVNPAIGVSLTGEGVVINPAQSGVCYASTGNNDGGRLITINNTTGAGTLIGDIGLDQVPGLAINSNGDIYGTDGNADLYKIDAASGTSVFIGGTGLDGLPAIAFDGNDMLYGLGFDAITFQYTLYTINTSTGVPTVVGPAPMGDWRGMAFDPTDGTLWASTNGDKIYVINPSTGEPTLIGITGLDGGVPDIHFDDMGNLFGALGGGGAANNSLISIDKSTGTGNVIGPIGFTSVSGLASRQQPLTGSQIGIIPPKIDFWHIEVGTSSSLSAVTIRSVGSVNLTVSGISDPGSPFSLTNVPTLPVVIPPGSSETFEVIFSPASAGVSNSTISVTSDDPDDMTKEVSLTGLGVVLNQAMSGVCYASTGFNDGGRLLTINNTTGAGTLIGPSGLNLLPGLAINSNGDMYAASDDPSADLFKIDAGSGAAVYIGSTGLEWIPAIAFDGNNVLYGVGTDFSTYGFNLYTFNTSTGEPTLIGPASTEYNLRGLDFDPTDGRLWASTNGEEIYTINSSTGVLTLVGKTGFNGGIPDIHFDENGNLYGALGGGGNATNNFISINKSNGVGTIIGPIGFTSVSGMAARLNRVVGINDEKDSDIPNSYALAQNYPNPFNPATIITYQIPNAGNVTLKVYGILGNEVRTLINEEKPAGKYSIEFSATGLSSGVYFYKLQSGSFVETRKMILIK